MISIISTKTRRSRYECIIWRACLSPVSTADTATWVLADTASCTHTAFHGWSFADSCLLLANVEGLVVFRRWDHDCCYMMTTSVVSRCYGTTISYTYYELQCSCLLRKVTNAFTCSFANLLLLGSKFQLTLLSLLHYRK